MSPSALGSPLFDLQVNGFAGVDFQQDDLPAAAQEHALTSLRARRTGRVLRTLITDTIDALCRRLEHVEKLRARSPLAQAVIAGYHLEGPWLNPRPRGGKRRPLSRLDHGRGRLRLLHPRRRRARSPAFARPSLTPENPIPMKLATSDFASVARRLLSRLVPVLALVVALLSPVPLHAQAPLPRALWVWQADNITDTAKRANLIGFCVNKGISTLFISTGRVFVDPADPSYASRHPVTRAQLGQFNIAAHAAGLLVFALDGDPSYCLASNHDRVLGRVEQAVDFNQKQSASARLDGFQWDIEPHGLAAWAGASNAQRLNYLGGLLTVAQEVVAVAGTAVPSLKTGFVVPFWYDNTEYIRPFNGTTKRTSEHLFDIVGAATGSHLAIMAYRDTAASSFPLAQTEYDYAKTSAPGVKIWHGLETGPFSPAYITFHEEGETALDNAIDALRTTYLPSYRGTPDVVAGVAIHAYNYYGGW